VNPGIADNRSPLRRSATDGESDQESDNERLGSHLAGCGLAGIGLLVIVLAITTPTRAQ
jgi:hypothetical protein